MQQLSPEYLTEEYSVKNRSDRDIAAEHNTHHKKISRLRKKYGIPSKTRSEAQSIAIKLGRHPHPTKGKTHSDKAKYKISEAVANWWNGLTDDEIQARSNRAKEQWDSMPESQKKQMRTDAAIAVRNAAKIGSKLERFLYKDLSSNGYHVQFHKEDLVVNQKLHIDLFLPKEKVCIEVDGPAHFDAIWGQENLDKHVARDAQKSGLVLGAGFTMLRVKHTSKNISVHGMRELSKKIIDFLENNKTTKLFEIEV